MGGGAEDPSPQGGELVGPMELLGQARRRLRWRKALGAAELAALTVLASGLVVQMGGLVVPYALRWEWVLLTAAVGSVVAAAAGYFWRPPRWEEAAHCVDRGCRLEDRLTTWLAVQKGLRSKLVDHFLQDVARSTQGLRIREAVPLGLHRHRALLTLMACVVAWDLFLSGITLPHTPARRVAEVVRREGQRLGELARTWEVHARARALAEILKSARAVQEAAEHLTSPRATADVAQRELANLRSKMQRARGRLQAQATSLGAPAGPQGLEPDSQTVRALEAELAKLGRTLEEVSLSREQAEQLQRALERLRGTLPLRSDSPTHSALRQAQRNLERGDRKTAREALHRAQEAMRELARLIEEEGALAAHQAEVEASTLRIGRAVQGAADPEAAQEHPMTYPVTAYNRPASDGAREEVEAEIWEGPEFGIQPGAGHVREKLGPATPRLQAFRTPETLRGEMREGKVYAARLPGPAGVGEVRVPLVPVSARVVRQADEVLRAQRVPGPYREWVRRYFAELAASGR